MFFIFVLSLKKILSRERGWAALAVCALCFFFLNWVDNISLSLSVSDSSNLEEITLLDSSIYNREYKSTQECETSKYTLLTVQLLYICSSEDWVELASFIKGHEMHGLLLAPSTDTPTVLSTAYSPKDMGISMIADFDCIA